MLRLFLFLALVALATLIVTIANQACQPGYTDQQDIEPQEVTITLDPCDLEPETGRWCFPAGWEFSECFQTFQVSWSPDNATLSLRTYQPVCPHHLRIHDSECEWLDESFDWFIDATPDPEGNWFWEIVIEFEPAFADCVAAYPTWCIEIEIKTLCYQ